MKKETITEEKNIKAEEMPEPLKELAETVKNDRDFNCLCLTGRHGERGGNVVLGTRDFEGFAEWVVNAMYDHEELVTFFSVVVAKCAARDDEYKKLLMDGIKVEMKKLTRNEKPTAEA